MMLKPGLAKTVLASGNSGMEMFLSEMIETSASCTSGMQRVISSKRSSAAGAHGHHRRRRDEVARIRPFGDDAGDVPRILDVFLGGAGGALDCEGGIAGNGGREMFAEPALAGARIAHKQQGAVGGERDDGPLDDRGLAVEFSA